MVKLRKLRPRCFFDVTINDEHAGRIIFELFNDICPKTCENFKALCTGEKGVGKLTGKPLHYKNVVFHRVVKNFIIQSGDFSLGNGKGGESIYGGTFEDETFHFKHEKPFLLSMANRGKNTNGSQFFITLAPAHHLDGSHVVFGHVISGQEIVLKISEQPVDKNSRPTNSIKISNCGELVPQIKPKEKSKTKKRNRHEESDDDDDDDSQSSGSSTSDSDSSSDSTSSDEDDKEKKPSLEKGDDNQKNVDHTDQNDDPEQSSISLFNPKYNVKINPEEIPEVPKNKFLDRANVEKLKAQQKDDRSHIRRYSYDKSGRQIKGRGSIRYRTPSPDYGRSRRSETPPHWRYEQSRLKSFEQVVARHKRRNRDGQSEKSFDHDDDHRHQRRSRSREMQTSHRYRDYRGRSERTRDYSDLYPVQSRDDGHHSRNYHSEDYNYKHRKSEHRNNDNENHDSIKDRMKNYSNGNKNEHDNDKHNGNKHHRDSKDDRSKIESKIESAQRDQRSSKEKTSSKGKYKRFKEIDSPVSRTNEN